MSVYCQNCGRENRDPGTDLYEFTCGYCGKGPLSRVPKDHVEGGGIVGAGIGAAMGAGIGGPVGAVVGAFIGFFLGQEAGKRP